MSRLKLMVFLFGIGLVTTSISLSIDSTDEASDSDLARVFGEGVANTICQAQAACSQPNTCAVKVGAQSCTGIGGCSGPANRICVFSWFNVICNQTPIQTCCKKEGCIYVGGTVQNPNGTCVPNGIPAATATGSRNNC
jgi:hypothetical protein